MKQENGHVTKITNLSKDKVLRDLWASSAGFLDGGVLTVEPDQGCYSVFFEGKKSAEHETGGNFD